MIIAARERESNVSLQNDIQIIMRQEAVLRFAAFNEADAWALGGIMHQMAVAKGWPMVIDIRLGARVLFYAALPGSTAENPDWVRRKVNTVLRFGCSSYLVGRRFQQSGKAFDASEGIDPISFANHGGGFPLHLTGSGVVGAITVSGVPQRDDHDFVVAGIAAFLGVDGAGLALPPQED